MSIGTPRCKTVIFDNLRYVKPDPDGKAVPDCWHFPKVERAYFEGLCSERRVIKADGSVVWQKVNPRNEPLDLAVYARAAYSMVGADHFKEATWLEFERQLKPTDRPNVPTAAKMPTQPSQPRAPQRRTGTYSGF